MVAFSRCANEIAAVVKMCLNMTDKVFSGFLDEIEGISVDRFERKNFKRSQMLFLTNFFRGGKLAELDKAKLAEHLKDAKLFCTSRTMQMLTNLFSSKNLDFPLQFEELEIGKTYDMEIPSSSSDESNEKLKVTVIDANFCVGACMFLFETSEKTVLYTSDFRYTKDEIPLIRALHELDGEKKRLDAIYIDCSFFDQRFSEYPSVQANIDLIIEKLRQTDLNMRRVRIIVNNESGEVGAESQIIRGISANLGELIEFEDSKYHTIYNDIPHVSSYVSKDGDAKIILCSSPECTEDAEQRVSDYKITLCAVENKEENQQNKSVVDSQNELRLDHTLHATEDEISTLILTYKPKKVKPCSIPSLRYINKAQKKLDKLCSMLKSGPAILEMAAFASKFDGRIDGVEFTSIDRFTHVHKFSAFFLTHCHTDHTNGIGNLSTLETKYTFYCSRESAQILKNLRAKLKLSDRFFDHVQVLDVGRRHTIVIKKPDDADSNAEDQIVKVTPISANHCLGACMFLFETEENQRVLFTGDFRFSPNQLKDIKELHYSDGTVKGIDLVYLDTTFFNQINHAKVFPSEEESLQMIEASIDKYLFALKKGDQAWIHIKPAGFIGSEEIIVKLSKKYKTKIHFHEEECKCYTGFEEIESCITTEGQVAFIHMCKIEGQDVNSTPRKEVLCKPPSNALHIVPSALYFAIELGNNKIIEPEDLSNGGFVRIARSRHSSHSELKSFLKHFRPRRAFAWVIHSDKNTYSFCEMQADLDKMLDDIHGKRHHDFKRMKYY
ncbi:DNA cross-link repair 1A protein-like isoform X2 [Neocloeon triangulifer]|uniref:DNA cross-link repair 1A protein-like isoform X2 n=1 Tax=Neocloeon triangulifer TaxID=2078957 RepID=UPI00286F980E|nr:DNA cross-link repair 1A protein-like isoform X2 [Neocloeon triangulifer]